MGGRRADEKGSTRRYALLQKEALLLFAGWGDPGDPGLHSYANSRRLLKKPVSLRAG